MNMHPKRRDVFRAWLAGKCEYLSSSGDWARLPPPDLDNASYLGSTKYYRVKNAQP